MKNAKEIKRSRHFKKEENEINLYMKKLIACERE